MNNIYSDFYQNNFNDVIEKQNQFATTLKNFIEEGSQQFNDYIINQKEQNQNLFKDLQVSLSTNPTDLVSIYQKLSDFNQNQLTEYTNLMQKNSSLFLKSLEKQFK